MSEFSAFELELNALVRKHFPHWVHAICWEANGAAAHDENVVWHPHPVTVAQREQLHGQYRGVVLWFTGLSGSSKSTVCQARWKRRCISRGEHLPAGWR